MRKIKEKFNILYRRRRTIGEKNNIRESQDSAGSSNNKRCLYAILLRISFYVYDLKFDQYLIKNRRFILHGHCNYNINLSNKGLPYVNEATVVVRIIFSF